MTNVHHHRLSMTHWRSWSVAARTKNYAKGLPIFKVTCYCSTKGDRNVQNNPCVFYLSWKRRKGGHKSDILVSWKQTNKGSTEEKRVRGEERGTLEDWCSFWTYLHTKVNWVTLETRTSWICERLILNNVLLTELFTWAGLDKLVWVPFQPIWTMTDVSVFVGPWLR